GEATVSRRILERGIVRRPSRWCTTEGTGCYGPPSKRYCGRVAGLKRPVTQRKSSVGRGVEIGSPRRRRSGKRVGRLRFRRQPHLAPGPPCREKLPGGDRFIAVPSDQRRRQSSQYGRGNGKRDQRQNCQRQQAIAQRGGFRP